MPASSRRESRASRTGSACGRRTTVGGVAGAAPTGRRRTKRRWLRLGAWLALMAAAVAAIKSLQLRRYHQDGPPRARPEAWPPVPSPPPAADGVPGTPAPEGASPTGGRPDPEDLGTQPWVGPEGTSCPATHPVKAKLSSRIYHLPGMASYDRTRPDRCYRDEAAAEADSLRRAKR